MKIESIYFQLNDLFFISWSKLFTICQDLCLSLDFNRNHWFFEVYYSIVTNNSPFQHRRLSIKKKNTDQILFFENYIYAKFHQKLVCSLVSYSNKLTFLNLVEAIRKPSLWNKDIANQRELFIWYLWSFEHQGIHSTILISRASPSFVTISVNSLSQFFDFLSRVLPLEQNEQTSRGESRRFTFRTSTHRNDVYGNNAHALVHAPPSRVFCSFDRPRGAVNFPK